jgi:hypothetical protein
VYFSLHENAQNNWARQKLNDKGADIDASAKEPTEVDYDNCARPRNPELA